MNSTSRTICWIPQSIVVVLLWLASAAAFTLGADLGAESRLGVPSAADGKAAIAAVERIYQPKINAVKTPGERAKLAEEIFANRNEAANPAELYGIQVTALALATKGDDPSLLLAICDALANDFKVDRIELLTERIGQTTGVVNPIAWPQCLQRLTALVSECTAAGRFDEATRLAAAVASLAKRARDPKAVALAGSFKKSISESRKAHEKLAKLKAEASQPGADPAALLELGRLYCVSRNEWSEGCRYLARSGDPVLSKPASLEIKAASADQKLVTADAWSRAADEAIPGDRRAIRDHAAVLYTEILPELTGLAKVKAENRLEQLLGALNAADKGGQQTQWTVIFRSAKPDVWNTDSSDVTNFAVALDKLPPFVRYVRLRRANGDAVILAIERSAMGSEISTEPYGWNGTNIEFAGAKLLGISDRRKDVDKQTGSVVVSRHGASHFTGWGFGHRIHHGGQAELCWNGKWIPREVLEISVIGRGLTPAEERFLLR